MQDVVDYLRANGHIEAAEDVIKAERMEHVPQRIYTAIDCGYLEVIKDWVAAGGDPNALLDGAPIRSHLPYFDRNRYDKWVLPRGRFGTLLGRAATFGRKDIAEYLLSRGARVDITNASEGCRLTSTPLCRAAVPLKYYSTIATVRLLLSHGADANLASPGLNCPPLLRAVLTGGSPRVQGTPYTGDGNYGFHRLGELVPIVRMLLRAGADPAHQAQLTGYDRFLMAESCARDSERFIREGRNPWYDSIPRPANVRENHMKKAREFAEAADLLAEVRIAGSWPRYFLRPHMRCLVFRALCQRGRVTFDHATPTVLVYLFGAPPSRGYALWREQSQPLRLLRHIDPHMPDIPDVAFWRVLTFMFGTAYDYPWVRPRLRARAAAAAAARS